MTRLRKIEPEELEKEYVFGSESLGELAERHGLSKSAVAGYAARGKWAEKRTLFKGELLERIRAALTTDWAEYESSLRRQMIDAAIASLTAYRDALASGRIELSGKDAIAWIGLIRSMLDELRPKDNDEPEEMMDPDVARQIIAQVDELLA